VSRDEDAIEQRLYRAARLERPSADVRNQTLRAMIQSASESDDEHVVPSGVRGTTPPTRRARQEVSFALAVAACGAVAVTALVMHGRNADLPLTSEPSRPAELTQPSASAAPSADPSPVLRRPPPAETPSVARPVPEPQRSAPPSLSEEIAALDAVRQQLGGGDASEALRLLDRYAAASSAPRLADEATLLRIEALLRAGRRDDATQLAARFVERNPNSPLSDRVRALVSGPLKTPQTGASP